MATGTDKEQEEVPFELLVHPSHTLYDDIFLLRTPFSINKKTTCIKSVAGQLVVYCAEFDTSVGISAVVKATTSILHTHGVSHSRLYHDEVSLLYEMDITSQLSSLKSFFSTSDIVKTNLAGIVANLFKKDFLYATITVEADFKLYRVSPITGTSSPNVRLVTLANISHYSNAYKESKMFDFSSALFDQAQEDHEAGCDEQGVPLPIGEQQLEFTTDNLIDLSPTMATGTNVNQEEGPFELLLHPSPTVHDDIFLLRTPFSINKEAACIKPFAGRPVVYCAELDTSVGISAVVKATTCILRKHGVTHCHSYHDEVSPLYEMDVASQLTSLKALLSKCAEVQDNLSVVVESLFKNSVPNVPISVETSLELYHVSPRAESTDEHPNVHLVTLANISHYSQTYNKSKVFNFSSSFFQGAQRNYLAGKDEKAETVEVRELHKELAMIADIWLPLGLHLEIPLHVLRGIEMNRSGSDDDCLISLLEWWDKNMKPAWSKVVRALCTVNRKECAWKIAMKYNVPFSANEEEWIEEVKEKQRYDKQAQESRQGVIDSKDGIERLLTEGSELTSKVKELEDERVTLEKQLENEQELCRVLNKCKEDYIQEKRGFQKRLKKQDESHFAKLRAIEHQVNEREEAVKKLKGDLVVTNQAYQDTKDQLRKLSSELAEKTTELEEKSFHLRTLEDTQIEDGHHCEVEARQRLESEDVLLKAAREESQEAYLTEIQRQLSHAEQEVDQKKENITHLNTHISQLEDDVSKVSNELKINQKHLQQLKLRATAKSHQNDAGNEDVFKLQIVVTKMNIRLVDSRYQLILKKRELKSAQEEYKQCAHRQQIKKQLMPDLSKCSIEGLDLPLHKTNMKTPIQFKVHLCDRDGEPCTGEHVVTARETRSQELFVEEHDEDCGTYTLTYTPRILGEHSFSVFINDVPLNSEPLCLVAYNNTPHLPNCTVSGEGLNSARQNIVASCKVNLLDKDGDPVAAEQTVSASLSQEGGDCLVLPPDVATTETPGMYVVSYLPGRPGVCELTVLVNGKPIGGSSFRVDVAKTGFTPLTGAALSGHQRFLLALLDKGADVNERDRNGNTALHRASSEGHKDAVDLLLLKGAQVDSQNNYGDTALHLASDEGYKDTVEVLVQKGAQVDSKNNDSWTPLMLAARWGHTQTVETLIRIRADVNAKDEVGDTALHKASRRGHGDTVELLLLKGAQVDSQNNDSWTPLMLAAYNGHTQVTETLIGHGADVNAKDKRSQTALDIARSRGHTEVCKILQSHK